MKLRFNLLTLNLLLVLAGCELVGTNPGVEVLEGREPEVVTWVSGQQWFPSTIALLVIQEEQPGYIYLEANSSGNRGYKRTMRLNISESDFNWPPTDTLNLLNTHLPTKVSAEYEQFRDRQNLYSSKWQSETNDLGGIRITAMEEEDGIEYAAGNFFMSPYIFINRPDTQEISGLFNNVRVFHHADSMEAYFDKITAIEAAGNN